MNFIKGYWKERSELGKLLILSSIFSVAMVIIRAIVTERLVFIFLPWNLFLAAVPYFISTAFVNRSPRGNKLQLCLLCTAWLLFIPNSFYIITDLFHLKLREESTRWFDLTLIFSFAWNGLLLGMLSVRHMEKTISRLLKIRQPLLFLLPVMWLIAFGVHIGRFMRFNSWDVITNPFSLIQDIGYMLIHPIGHFHSWGTIGCFAVFMTLIYVTVKRIAHDMQ